MKKLLLWGLCLFSAIVCINVNADVKLERSFPYTDGSIDLIFKDVEIDSTHTYKWAIEKLESTTPSTYFDVLSPDYENKTLKISLLSSEDAHLAVLKSVDTAYITIKDDADNVILKSHKVDLTLDPFAGFTVEKSSWYGGAPTNPAYEIWGCYGIVSKNIQFMFEKIEDAEIINNYVDNNKDLSKLNLKSISEKPSVTDTRWATVYNESYYDEGRVNNQDMPTESGLYYLWLKGSGSDIKTVYGYNVIEVGTVEKVPVTSDTKDEESTKTPTTSESKDDSTSTEVKDETVESPKTGLEDYALVIVGGILLVAGCVVVINKNKKFHRI